MGKMKDFLVEMQQVGIDRNGLIVDPLFRDPENGDFTILSGSPLLQNGFVPVDQSTMGLTSEYPERFVTQ